MNGSVRTNSRPRLWILAGPNGCGKSSTYDNNDVEDFGGSVWIVNPDLLTRRLQQQEGLPPDEANLEAVNRIERWLRTSIEVHQTVGVETVLSTPKYQDLVCRAKDRGFEVRLIYVIVKTVEIQLERILRRVQAGGHDVPEHKVRTRRLASLEQLRWFLEQADRAWIFDNSGAKPKKVGEKLAPESALRLDPEAPNDLKNVLLARSSG